MVRERKKFIAEKKICEMCFMNHNVKDCDKKDYKPCNKNGCIYSMNHHKNHQ